MKYIDYNDPPRNHFIREPPRLAIRKGFVTCSQLDDDMFSFPHNKHEESRHDIQLQVVDKLEHQLLNRPFPGRFETSPRTEDFVANDEDYLAIMDAIAENEVASSSVKKEMNALINFCRQEGETCLDDERISYEFGCKVSDHCGDVKRERWQAVPNSIKLNNLPTEKFTPSCCASVLTEEFCPICQCDYDYDETLRRLPCGHRFHVGCVDRWLQENSTCPCCQESILTK